MNGNDTTFTQMVRLVSHFWDPLVNVRAIIQMDDKETGITEMYVKDKFISKMDTKENAT